MKLKFIITFFLIICTSFFILKYEKDTRVNNYLNQVTNNYVVMYDTLIKQFQDEATIIYDTVINQTNVKNIYIQMEQQDNETLRDKLYDLLSQQYSYYQKIKLKQLHFHTKDNKSFLRMHMPSKHSDDLTLYRKTVVYVNKNHEKISGFETGKIYSGMRYVFPLQNEDQYLGSVEISFDISAFTTQFMDSYKVICNFHLKKNIIDNKTWEEYIKEYYLLSPFDNYYLEKKVLEEINKRSVNFVSQKDEVYEKKTKEIGLLSIENSQATSVYDQNIDNVVTFIPAINPVNKKVEAFFTVRSDADFIRKTNQDFYAFFSLISVFTSILLLLIYKIISNKDSLNLLLKEKVEEQTKELNKTNKNLEKIVLERTSELEKSKVKLQEYIHLIDENIITSSTDLEGKITYVSQAFCKISGYQKEELIGFNHNIINHPDIQKSLFVNMWEDIKNNKVWKGEIKNLKKNGGFYWVKITIYPLFENGKQIGYTAIAQDVTNKKKIEQISITDGLTAIYNRRHFNTVFPKIINSAKRHNELISLIIMDVDHFKQYNDTYGHQMGDTVLVKIAQVLSNKLNRADDYCFRLGGEEFGVIFKTDTQEKAFEFANRIRQSIEDIRIEHSQNSASKFVTASMGLVCMSAHDIKTDDELYKYADDMLYEAKRSGRNKVFSNINVKN